MATHEVTYHRRLAKGAKPFGVVSRSQAQLWLADDHMLYLEKRGYSEFCRRFYFKDIQAFTLCPTPAYVVLNIIHGSLAALGLILFLSEGIESPMGVGSLIWTAFWGILLLMNLAKGPTCLCKLHTAVQVQDLVPLRRRRKAVKTLAALKGIIDAEQGEFTPEMLEGFAEAGAEVKPSAYASIAMAFPGVGRIVEEAEKHHEHGTLHVAVFSLLLVLSLSSAIDLVAQHDLKDTFDSLLYLGAIVVVILALRRQRNSDLPREIHTLTWVALGSIVGSFLIGVFSAAAVSMFLFIDAAPSGAAFDAETIDLVTHSGPFLVYLAIAAAVFAVVGFLGLVRLRAFHHAYNTAQARAAVIAEKPETEADETPETRTGEDPGLNAAPEKE